MGEPGTRVGRETPGERDGSWGDAGGLPVADRPLAPAPATTGDTAPGRMYREAFLRAHDDREMFAALLDIEPGLSDVVARLKAEHGAIAAALGRFDRALVRVLHEGAGAIWEVAAVTGELSDLLLSHLAYEEDQLHHGLGRIDLAL